jgi:hypothetical protein
MRRRSWLTISMLTAGLASLAACGGGGSEAPSPSTGTPPPAGAPQPAPAPSPAPSAIADLEPGQWMELPNTKIRSVLPQPTPQGSPEAIVLAWNGGTVDSARSRLLVWGGGHSDYWGNEMYALDLPTLSIRRIVEPSPQTAQANCTSALPDGTPTARHTYDGLAYIAHADQFFSVNGSMAPCGDGDRATFTYDFATNRWQMPVAQSPWSEPFGTMAVYDAQTQQVFVKPAGHDFYAYAPQTQQYTRLNGTQDQQVDYHLSAAIDSKRRKFVMIGDGVQVIDLQTFRMSTMATVNAPALVSGGQSPGTGYDALADRIVAWKGGRNVYALDMDSGVWTQVATNAGPTSAAKEQGTFGRWGYVPQYKVFALINDIDENAWVFRLAK